MLNMLYNSVKDLWSNIRRRQNIHNTSLNMENTLMSGKQGLHYMTSISLRELFIKFTMVAADYSCRIWVNKDG